MTLKLKNQSFLPLKVVGVAAFVFILAAWFFLLHPPQSKSASLTNASATLSNSRISFYGVVDTGADIGDNAVNIKTSGSYADENTNHLFPKDTVAVGAEGALTVASIIDTNTFLLELSGSFGRDFCLTGARYLIASSGQTLIQLKHPTHLEKSTFCSLIFMQVDLQAKTHFPHFVHLSSIILISTFIILQVKSNN